MERRVQPRRAVAMEVQNQEILGDRLFQLKNYKGAIERFDKSLERKETARNLQYRIHNKKAHAFIKLTKYDAAVRAAGESIKLAGDNADGYLLAAQALNFKKKVERAIQVLEAGLKKMKAGDEKWKKIKKYLDDAKAKQNLIAKRRDFLGPNKVANFPMELVFKIFGYMDQKDILRCEQVSKQWKTVIRSNPEFFQSFEINARISSDSVNRWLNLTENSAYKVQHLGFTLRLNDVRYEKQKKFLFNVAGACKQLKSVRLRIEDSITREIHELYPGGSNTLKKLVLEGIGDLCMTDISVMVNRLPVLEHAEFHCVTEPKGGVVLQWPASLSNLKTIYIIGKRGSHRAMPETMLGLSKLITAAPNVRDAVFNDFGVSCVWAKAHDFRAWKFLETLNIHKLRIAKLPAFPRTLRHLNLSDIATVSHHELDNAKIGMIDISSYELPNLVSLDVEGSDFTHFTCELSNAGLSSGTLQNLKIGDTTHIAAQEDPYMNWPKQMPGPSKLVLALSLKNLNHISEDVIIKLLAQYPQLVEVNLSNCNITGTTIGQLFKKGRVHPFIVDVRGCANVGRDAVEAARETGCTVYSEHMPRKQVYNGRTHLTY